MKWVTVPVVVLALLVLAWGCVFAELGLGEGSSVQWQRSFFSGDGCSVFQTSDGGYVVSANDSVNSFLIKTDSLGNQVWVKTYDVGESMTYLAKTNDNGFALAGTWENEYALLKVSSEGDEMWNKTYSFDAPINYLRDFIQTSDGGYALLGFHFDSSHGSNGQIWFGKTDSSGNMLWNTTITGGEPGSLNRFNSPNTVIQTANGYVIMDSNYFLPEPLQSAYRLLITDENGNVQQSHTYGGEDDYNDPECTCGIATSDGGYLLAGFLFGRGAWMVKTNLYGDMVWNQTYGIGNSAVNHVIQTCDGGYNFVGVNDVQEIWQVQTNSEGAAVWNMTYSGTRLSEGLESNYNSLIQTADGGYVIAGTKDGAVWLAKIEPPIPVASSTPFSTVSPKSPAIAVPLNELAAATVAIIIIALVSVVVFLNKKNRNSSGTIKKTGESQVKRTFRKEDGFKVC